MMRSTVAALLAACSVPALAQAPAQDPARRAAERDLIERIVEIPTVAGRPAEFRKLTTLLTAEFRKAGITNVIVKDHDNTQTLIARWPAARPTAKKPIVLMAHMDVVEAKASDWQNPPFEFREKDGYYLGRGVADNKGELAGVVLALQELRRQGFQPTRDIIVLFTGDEETTMNGVRRASTEWRSLIDAEYGLNFDGGGGSVFKDGRVEGWYMQVAEKTYADYKLVATNRGGHSSGPRPDNAIYALAGALKAIEAHRFQPMINEATRGAFAHSAATDRGQFRGAGQAVPGRPEGPRDRGPAGGGRAWLDPDPLRRDDAVGRPRTQCLAAAGGRECELPDFPRRGDRYGARPVAVALGPRCGRDHDPGIDHAGNGAVAASRRTSPTRYRAAVGTRFPNAPVVPFQSAGATDGAYLRSVGIPVYGVGGTCGASSASEAAPTASTRRCGSRASTGKCRSPPRC